jgi:hypothetical protein
LFVSDLECNLRVAFQVMKPSWMSVKTRIGGSNHVGAIMFKISQRCDSLFTSLATDSGQQEDRQSLYLAAELSTAEAIEENIDRHEESEDVEK